MQVGSGPELAHPWRRIQFFLFGSATFYNGTVVCRALILMFSTGLFQEDFLNPDRRALGAAEADPFRGHLVTWLAVEEGKFISSSKSMDGKSKYKAIMIGCHPYWPQRCCLWAAEAL